MRLIAWNVNHRTRRKPIPVPMPEALLSLQPDVVVLTEYVPGKDHQYLCDSLVAGGLAHVHISERVKGQNQVLVATRSSSAEGNPLRFGQLPHADSNYLHVCLPTLDLSVIGFRVPAYTQRSELRRYWQWLEQEWTPPDDRQVVVIGDMNADPLDDRYVGSAYLRRIAEKGGWKIPAPEGEWSYWSLKGYSSRIDQALVKWSDSQCSARYLAEHAGFVFAGPDERAMSDHAVLVLDVVTTGFG